MVVLNHELSVTNLLFSLKSRLHIITVVIRFTGDNCRNMMFHVAKFQAMSLVVTCLTVGISSARRRHRYHTLWSLCARNTLPCVTPPTEKNKKTNRVEKINAIGYCGYIARRPFRCYRMQPRYSLRAAVEISIHGCGEQPQPPPPTILPPSTL